MKAGVVAGLVLSLSGLTTSSPLAQRDDFKTEDWQGLDFSRVNNPEYCTPEQAAVIKETIRKVAFEFIPHAIKNFDTHGVKDGAFHQIWMGRGETKINWEVSARIATQPLPWIKSLERTGTLTSMTSITR